MHWGKSEKARHLKGANGLGGTDSETFASWLLKFETYSQCLRNATARLAKWLSNGKPPWDTYSALMAGRLIALDKNQGVRQIAIGEVLRQYPKPQYLRSHETGKWLQTPISYVMENFPI